MATRTDLRQLGVWKVKYVGRFDGEHTSTNRPAQNMYDMNEYDGLAFDCIRNEVDILFTGGNYTRNDDKKGQQTTDAGEHHTYLLEYLFEQSWCQVHFQCTIESWTNTQLEPSECLRNYRYVPT
jgi:hypothetical protein